MKNGDLTIGPIPGLIKQVAIPSTVGFFFYTMFNIVDTWFGGMISTEALAALGSASRCFFPSRLWATASPSGPQP
jgi:Na+-driven multidrug efflux pump